MFFSGNSLTGRRVRSNVHRYAGFVVLLVILLLAGCEQGGSSVANVTANLNGVWNDGFGKCTIDTTAKTIVYENNYEGKIVNSPNFSAANGVLIIQFTKYWDADYSSYPDTTYNENFINIDKYGARYWKDLTSNSVYMADAYSGYTHAIVNTLTEAQTNFTMDSVGSYIDWSIVGIYTK